MMTEVSHKVDAIIEELNNRLLPEGAFARGKREADLTLENFGTTVVVSNNPAVRIILSILQVTTRIRRKTPPFLVTVTLEESLQLIKKFLWWLNISDALI